MENPFWEKLQRKLTNFFVDHVILEIMTQEMNPTELETDEEKVYCVCKGSRSDRKMIACDNTACKYESFHYTCVGIKRAPKGKWYCPYCSPSDT